MFTQPPLSLYDLLGVTQSDSQETLKKAYHQKAKRHHPDKNHDKNTNEEFARIVAAYETLSDAKERAEYDEKMGFSEKKFSVDNLSALVKENNLPEIKKIIQTEIKKNGCSWYENDTIKNAARDAAVLGNNAILEFLLSEHFYLGASIKEKEADSNKKHKLIYFSVIAGHLSTVKLLVEKGADIRPYSDYYKHGDNTPIIEAVARGHVDIADYLLEQGASISCLIEFPDFEVYNGGTTLLAKAIQDKNEPMVAVLLKHGASISEAIHFSSIQFNISLKLLYAFNKVEPFHFIEQRKLNKKSAALKKPYTRLIKTLLDHAHGIDLPKEKNPSSFAFIQEKQDGLTFLHNIDISGFQFMGVSTMAGRPITHAMLNEEKLEGADKAIITKDDLFHLKNKQRKARLTERLDKVMKEKRGFEEPDGTINLVPLVRAVQAGDYKAVAARLKGGTNPNDSEGYEKEPPIIFAARNNAADLVDLISSHRDFNIKSLPDAHKAAENLKHHELAESILASQNINQLDDDHNALIHYAVRDGNVEKVKKLIEKKANINLVGSIGSPLIIAATYCYDSFNGKPSPNYIEILRTLLEHGAEPNEFFHRKTALDYASKSSEAIRLLMPVTHKSDFVDEEKIMPWYQFLLFDAYRSNEYLDILKILKEEKIDFNLKNNRGDTVLHWKMQNFSSLDQSKNMLRIIYRTKELDEYDIGDIERHQSRFIRDFDILNFFLENKILFNTPNDEGDTPIHLLVQHLQFESCSDYARIIDPCIQKGFDIDTPNYDGITLLHIAAAKNNLVLAKYLIRRKANINAEDTSGCTPLHFAATGYPCIFRPYSSFCEPHPAMVKYLMKQGSDLCARNKDDLTPLAYAKEQCDKEIKSNIHSAWPGDAKRAWLNEFKDIAAILSSGIKPIEKISRLDVVSGEVLEYKNSLTQKKSYEERVKEYKLSPTDLALLKIYSDDTTGRIINVPVTLNGHIYDLDTLLHIKNKKDPFTQATFSLGDIQPAKAVQREMEVMLSILQKKYVAFVPTEEIPKVSGYSGSFLRSLEEKQTLDQEQQSRCLIL